MIELVQGDCIEVMSRMPAGCADVCVTSPPYNLGIKYRSGFDDSMPRSEYLAWTGRWMDALWRVLDEKGSFFLNIGGKPSDPWGPFEVALQARAHGWKLQNVIYWVKSVSIDGSPVRGNVKPINSPRFLTDACEHVFHFTKSGECNIDRLSLGVPFADPSNLERGTRGKNGNLRCPGNVWYVAYETIQSRDKDRPHPATFPPELAVRCYKLHGRDYIRNPPVSCGTLDPFSGLGSSARAAKKLGLNHFGIELSGEDIEDAKRLLGEEDR